MTARARKPLSGIRVVEFAALGPAPFAAMMLSDLGAEVLRIDRPDVRAAQADILARGRASLAIDLKNRDQVKQVRSLVGKADIIIEGLRPRVMERLGLGPDVLCVDNPRLIYTRVTGWGQDGPLAQSAGHDINYIALAGVLGALGPASQPPTVPLNLVGDFGGGALYAVVGILAALIERNHSGLGQVIDAAMVDGAASLLAMYLSHSQGSRAGTGTERGAYFLDGSAPYYRCYECADGRYVALGAIEPKFWQTLLEGLGSSEPLSQELGRWEETSEKLAILFRQRSRDEWGETFAGTDACVTPVLTFEELSAHPHLSARGTFAIVDGVLQPAVAPRFSRTPGSISGPVSQPGSGGAELAQRWLATNGNATERQDSQR